MLEELLTGLAEWSQATFGSDSSRGPIGPLKHLAKEVQEVLASPNDVEEYADCFLLLVDAVRRAGIPFHSLVLASYDKLQKNKKRAWPTPVTDEPVEHNR